MPSICDLLTAEDAMEMEGLFDAVLRSHNERIEERDASFREVERKVFDWEGDLPEHFFF